MEQGNIKRRRDYSGGEELKWFVCVRARVCVARERQRSPLEKNKQKNEEDQPEPTIPWPFVDARYSTSTRGVQGRVSPVRVGEQRGLQSTAHANHICLVVDDVCRVVSAVLTGACQVISSPLLHLPHSVRYRSLHPVAMLNDDIPRKLV